MQSEQAWHGLKSCKFNYSEKIHIKPQDCITDFAGGEIQHPLGRVHFDPQYGDPYTWVPHLKTNIPRPGDGKSQEFPPGKQFIEHHPQDKKPRAQRLHLKEGQSGHIEDVPYGIKTFPPIHCEKRHEVEEMMGKKQRLEYLYQMRNGLPVASLGDKIYKNPEYAPDFFKEGGLITGSSNIQRKVNINQLHEKEMEKKVQLIQSKIKKGTLWTDKVKMDQDAEKKQDIEDLDTWIETTLKPSNPNYQDPDKFFENLEKQQAQDPKKVQANQKKAGKK
ncbi:unnamed protein product [Paramecium sonneborni]|uniref:Uncharacterized protein n=1 Tax=Paramecium sonneborni TaxID=65129 RepID=A0A8S1QFV5_9CILI|nr:unnamed protein product [Paramecium sonneborni]